MRVKQSLKMLGQESERVWEITDKIEALALIKGLDLSLVLTCKSRPSGSACLALIDAPQPTLGHSSTDNGNSAHLLFTVQQMKEQIRIEKYMDKHRQQVRPDH